MVKSSLQLLGYAFGEAGADPQSAQGPLVMKQSSYLKQSTNNNISYEWNEFIQAAPTMPTSNQLESLLDVLNIVCEKLSLQVSNLIRNQKKFAVIGGDHTSAIGTWSGAYDAIHEQGDMGLIWVDAHMDAHTPATTESGRIQGMPLAVLLGQGYPQLVNVGGNQPKFKFKNICLVGVRSYEQGEAAFLKKNNVRIFYIDEIKARGLEVVMQEAVEHVAKETIGFGISLDLDSLDPLDAPAVAVPEMDGIGGNDMLRALPNMVKHSKYIGIEIVEFDPPRDVDRKTEKLIAQIVELIANGVRTQN